MEGEEFGEHRLVATVNQDRRAAASEILRRISTAVELYSRGTEQADDMTLLVIRRK